MKKQINAHSETFIDKIFWLLIVAIIFTCCITTLSSCHTRKVLTGKSKSEVSIDSSFKKSEVKEEEKTSKVDSSGSEKTFSESETEIELPVDSIKEDLNTGKRTYYTGGRNLKIKNKAKVQKEVESLKTSLNASKSKDVKKDEGKVKIDDSKLEKTKDVETSGQSFGQSILIALAVIAIGGYWVYRTK